MDVKASSSGWNGHGVEAYARQLVSAAGRPAWSASGLDGLRHFLVNINTVRPAGVERPLVPGEVVGEPACGWRRRGTSPASA